MKFAFMVYLVKNYWKNNLLNSDPDGNYKLMKSIQVERCFIRHEAYY